MRGIKTISCMELIMPQSLLITRPLLRLMSLTYNIMLKTTLLELNESIQPCIFKPSLSRVFETPIDY
jgi:hypothetical protein